MRATVPSAASTGLDLTTFLISLTASFSRFDAKAVPRHPYAFARNLALNVQ
jgi:hypothetical protein